MARYRTIKPDFWDDEKLAKMPMGARLLFIGMWTFSDDYGIVLSNPTWLKSKVFPFEEALTPPDVRSWLSALETARMIIPLTYHGEGYFKIRTFLDHQKIDRPGKRTIPEPEEGDLLADHSTNPRRILDEPSTNPRRILDERSSLERRGVECKGVEEEGRPADTPSRATDQVSEIDVLRILGRTTGCLSEVERSDLQGLLSEGVTLEDIASAYAKTKERGKPKNNLRYLANMSREARDARLSGATARESMDALSESDPAWFEWLEYHQLPPKNHPRYREARDEIIRQGLIDNERDNRERPPNVQPYPLQHKVRELMEEAKADGR